MLLPLLILDLDSDPVTLAAWLLSTRHMLPSDPVM